MDDEDEPDLHAAAEPARLSEPREPDEIERIIQAASPWRLVARLALVLAAIAVVVAALVLRGAR